MRINSHYFLMKQWKVVTYMDARLEPYRTLVSFLGEALGPDYEVVLHDLTSEEGTIAAIVNNNISGRTEGAPLSNMALRFIHGRVYEKQPYVAGYQGASQAKGGCAPPLCLSKTAASLSGCSASTLTPPNTAGWRRSFWPSVGRIRSQAPRWASKISSAASPTRCRLPSPM